MSWWNNKLHLKQHLSGRVLDQCLTNGKNLMMLHMFLEVRNLLQSMVIWLVTLLLWIWNKNDLELVKLGRSNSDLSNIMYGSDWFYRSSKFFLYFSAKKYLYPLVSQTKYLVPLMHNWPCWISECLNETNILTNVEDHPINMSSKVTILSRKKPNVKSFRTANEVRRKVITISHTDQIS